MPADLTVVIPWRDTGCWARRAHFQHLHSYYASRWPVVVGDRLGEFNRSAARNAGVAKVATSVVAVVDADNLIPLQQLQAAATLAHSAQAMVKPFTRFGYLDEPTTHAYYAGKWQPGQPSGWEGPGPQEGFNGGAYVLPTALWPGFDEDFTGWGAEDDAFTIICRRRFGSARVVPGDCWHLWHPAQRWTSAENYQRLMEVYVRGNESS